MTPYPSHGHPEPRPSEAYAHWGTRLAAYGIDVVAPFVVAGVAGALLQLALGAAGEALAGLLILLTFGFIAWNLWFRQGRTGQSIGKGMLGIVLISEGTGRPVGAGMAFVRHFARIIDSVIVYIGWLFPLWDDKRQTVSDKIVGTVVVPGGDPAQEKF